MTCEEATVCIHEFLDHELSEHRHSVVRAHLEECPPCWRRFEFEQGLRAVIWEKGRGVRAPAYVFERVRRSVFDRGERRGRSRVLFRVGMRPAWAWGTALFLVLASGGVWMFLRGGGEASPLIAELVGDHIRYAVAEKPSEMVCSDAEEIETWLESRLGYEIVVPRFEGPRVRLIGGRLLDLGGRKVAYLFYQRGQHVLSLYVIKVSDGELCAADRLQLEDCRLCLVKIQNCELRLCRHRNCNILSWQEEGIVYAMVSDLNREQLLEVTCPKNIPG